MEIQARVYIILNKDLQMPVGKAAVQVGHGMDLIWDNISTLKNENTMSLMSNLKYITDFEDWKKEGRKKVTLGVKNDDELQKYKDKLLDAGYVVFEIIDNGVNFFDGKTRTGLAVFPVLQPIPELKRLQVYK